MSFSFSGFPFLNSLRYDAFPKVSFSILCSSCNIKQFSWLRPIFNKGRHVVVAQSITGEISASKLFYIESNLSQKYALIQTGPTKRSPPVVN